MTNMHLLGSTSHLDFERLEKGIIKSTKQSMIKKKRQSSEIKAEMLFC